MAVSITDLRTEVDQADATTGWTGSTSPQLYTTNPNPVESTGSLGMAVGTATDDLYHTITTADLTGVCVYVWVLPLGTMDTEANGGTAVVLGDSGGNRIGFHVGGSDVAAFRHSAGPVGWQCLVIDTGSYPTSGNTVLAGSAAAPPTGFDVSDVTQIGSMFKTLSKALGGTENCFTDIIRYGNDGIRVEGGTTGDRGNFAQIATEDRSTTDATAYGICRELGSGLYSLQGRIVFGDDGTGDSYFEEKNAVIAFEDRGLAVTRYQIVVEGNGTGTNLWTLGTKTGTDEGVDGVTITIPSGVGGSFIASNNNIDTFGIYGSTLSGFDQQVIFAPNTAYEVYSTSFIGCDIVDCDIIQFKNNQIQSSANTTGALLLPSSTTNFENIAFTQGTTGHAIYVNPTGAGPFTYDLTGITFSGYASANGSTGNECIYIDPVTSSANFTFNVAGGDTPSFRLAGGYTGTVTLNNNITITLTGIQTESEIRVYPASPTPAQGNQELVTGQESSNGSVTAATVVSGGTGYSVSDVLTVTGGTGTAATLTVTAVDGGVITAVDVTTAGDYSVNPTNPVSVTGGGGSAATFNLNISGEFAFSVAASALLNIIIFHTEFKEVRLASFTAPASDSSIPISQTTDRVYVNP